MAECKHVFIGRAEGVRCAKCGFSMSAEEYIRYIRRTGGQGKREAGTKARPSKKAKPHA